MNENKILNEALELINERGNTEAYNYLLEKKKILNEISSQYYNFLYCFAALSGDKNKALDFLEEAIIDKQLWYRTEVFEDDDLDTIRNTDRFVKCFEISEDRYKKALATVKTIHTWKRKESNTIVLALHGNQQNIEDSRDKWHFLRKDHKQVEYIQSAEIDSCGIYRWEDEGTGPSQLSNVISEIDWDEYNNKILCGFSAGCNVILNTILTERLSCNKIILQSPWIPMIDDKLEELSVKLKELNIDIFIICGTNDSDCFERSQLFYNNLKDKNINIEKMWINNLGHDFSDDYRDLILEYLKKNN